MSQTLSNSNFSLDFADAFYDRNGSIIIEKNATAGDIKFRLIDINGRVLKSSQFSNDKFIVSVGSLDNGVYFLELKSEDKSGIKKLLID
ncbi:T9SS type A sorting domain-containing protein [Flavobacterium sediminis]|uniref:T9SS type A sorting domain-containing protein n=1 Tax=Flavobacterium sediminis TaxID=2201181 RepID=UPI0014751C5A|nr:T9SS type A sorting domain-containing protein [Flavobacterium sediminis]